ncbi:CBS domain-containing protein [Pelagibacterium montanilacus]|uniref:CBS domain-containing protein n=1 Tax=Pelagibacterium montanilacus TaxID=2185280 RepID=UPI001FE3F6C1|nr:CBS domain-containing protein [Pelagibacterium montanilacus]
MSAGDTLSAWMVTDIASVLPDMEIGYAVRFLLDRRISGAPVVDSTGGMVGIITKKDCFRAALNAAYYKQWGGTVERYMVRDVETLDADLDIVSAAQAFARTPYRLFPVMRDGDLVGLLSRSDLLRAFLAQHG